MFNVYDQRRYAPVNSYCMYRLVGSTLVCVRYSTVDCQFDRLMQLYIIHPLRFFVLFLHKPLHPLRWYVTTYFLIYFYICVSIYIFVTYSESICLTDITRFE